MKQIQVDIKNKLNDLENNFNQKFLTKEASV